MSVPERARTRLAGMSPWNGRTSRPLQEFLHTEAGGAVLLLAATVVALVWANSPLSGAYDDLWGTKLTITLGGGEISEDLRHWVNDGLMVFFFYVVGLEIRREFAMGELTDKREAAVPAVAALAGMAVPALVFLVFNAGTDAARGWGIVMATDIAFVLGALALLGPACPGQLRVFLLTLAIVDDIGAIAVIAVFYSESIDLLALAIAAAILVVILLLRRDAGVARAGVLRGRTRAVGRNGQVGRPPNDRRGAAGNADRGARAHAGRTSSARPRRAVLPSGTVGRRGQGALLHVGGALSAQRAPPGGDAPLDQLCRRAAVSPWPTPGWSSPRTP
jgi:hypothetical protein